MRYHFLKCSMGLLMLCALAFGQQGPADCQFTATFSSQTPGTAFSNKPTATGGQACNYWTYSYWTNGASGVSVQLQGSADVAGVSSGSYTALTAAQGTANPATGTTQGGAVLCCDYYPWVRINPTTFTGSGLSMIVRVYGWHVGPVSPSSGGGPTANVNVNQYGGVATTQGQKAMAASIPVVIASDQSAFPVTPAANSSVNVNQYGGAATTLGQKAMAASAPVVLASDQASIPTAATQAGTWTVQPGNTANTTPWLATINQGGNSAAVSAANNLAGDLRAVNGTTSYGCGSQASFNLSGSGDTQIIAASGATVIRICHISFSTTAAEDVKVTRGTGANCATGTADVTGLYKNVSAMALDFGPFAPLTGAASGAICINQSVAQALGGIVMYDQR